MSKKVIVSKISIKKLLEVLQKFDEDYEHCVVLLDPSDNSVTIAPMVAAVKKNINDGDDLQNLLDEAVGLN